MGSHPSQLTSTEVVTLTLRTSKYWPDRNINLDEWFKFHNFLVEKGHKVVVIPDYEDIFDKSVYKKYNWSVFLPASIDQRIRLALYEQALMNFMPSVGAAAMVLYSNAPYVYLDLASKVWSAEHVSEKQLSIPIGASPPWAGENQNMIWEESNFANLVNAYDQYIG